MRIFIRLSRLSDRTEKQFWVLGKDGVLAGFVRNLFDGD